MFLNQNKELTRNRISTPKDYNETIKTIISIVIVYLVILAGGIVRMTGSGMGCPDWPKCFGFLIPPTERSQLEWKSNSEYNKNQIIIINHF